MEIRLKKIINWSTGELSSNFEESSYKSIREFTEPEIIDFIYQQKFQYQMHIEMGFSGSQKVSVLKEQKQPFILRPNEIPGDIDLVLFNREKPDYTVAVQVKCVKFETLEDQSVRINKAEHMSKGITQANATLPLGFHKTYLVIVLLDESWRQDTPNMIFKKSDLESAPKLVNPAVLENLNKNVGLLYMGIRQISKQSPYINTRVDIRKISEAVGQDQKESITLAINKNIEMEDTIRTLLLDHFREILKGKHIEQLGVNIINVINFHPFILNIQDLNNISGIDVGFTCWIEGKKKGVDKTKKTYFFSFNEVRVIMEDNEVTALNFDDLNIPFYTE